MKQGTDKRLAYLGLGIMGSAMAANLARAGCNVSVWNRTPGRAGEKVAGEAGARVCSSLSDAVGAADIIFLCLGDARDVDQVVLGSDGVASHARNGAIVVDMGTTGPLCARGIAQGLSEHAVRFLDAPVSGGDVGARNGTLTIMVGGEGEIFAECRPFFELMGKNIFHCGPVGSGQGVKLCNQILCAVNMVAVCEAMRLADELHLDRQLMIDVCSTGAGGSWALANLGPKIAKADYDPGFRIDHILKDLHLVGDVLDLEKILRGCHLAEQRFSAARMHGGATGGAQGTQAMFRAYS